MDKQNDLRMWYMDRVPCKKVTQIKVKTVQEAMTIIKAFILRDLNDDRITDIAFGLEVFEDNKWSEYYDEYGDDVLAMIDTKEEFNN